MGEEKRGTSINYERVKEMDRLDANIYYGLKESFRKAIKNISDGNLTWGEMPVILIDYYNFEVFYFESENDAEEHLKEHNTEWDDSPPEGEDEELIIIKYCDQEHKEKYKNTYKDYKFLKEINGVKIYRRKSFVEFEPELIINVGI